MVLPDGTGSERSRPRTGRVLLFALAALAIVAGFIILGSLSPSDQLVVETTTTTTLPEVEPPIDPEDLSVAQITTGPPLEWEWTVDSATGFPLAVAEHEGDSYLFATGTAPWAAEPGGLNVWRSTDGEDWQPLGETVIAPEFNVANVITSTEELIALGSKPGANHMIVWRSADAVEWTPTEFPTDTDSRYLNLRPAAAATFDGGLAIAPQYALDQERLLDDHLASAGIDVDLPTLTWSTRYGGEDGAELIVSGPLGLPVLTTGLDELGLTEQEYRWVMNGLDRGERSEIWVVDDAGNRRSGTIPLNWVNTMVSRADDTLFASGLGGAGLTDGFVSADGIEWEPADGADIATAISWGDRLVAVTGGPATDVLMSADGQTWEESGLADMFPTQWNWNPAALGAGPDGVAVTVEGPDTGFTPDAPPSASVTSGDATLSVDRQRGDYVLEIDGETHTWAMYLPSQDQVPEGLELDLANEEVVFEDPETGDTLARFGFEELYGLVTGGRTVRFSDVIAHNALAFTRDGSAWEIRDLDPIVGDDSRVALLGVAHGRLIAVVHEPAIDPTRRVQPSGFEVWTAPLP